jgi:hypothetical protein
MVETKKTFAAQFSSRSQKPGEGFEDYAAELKRLYNKAYPHRDEETRREDLLRRFLDGLYDERTRFHVEFVKEPNSIDKAVYEVVNFTETRRRPKDKDSANKYRPTRAVKTHYISDSEEELEMVQPDDSDDEDSGSDTGARIGRVPPKYNKSKKIQRPNEQDPKEPTQVPLRERMGKLEKLLGDVCSRLDGQDSSASTRNVQSRQDRRDKKKPSAENGCFKCSEQGHWARKCPNFRWVQVPKEDQQSSSPEAKMVQALTSGNGPDSSN